MTEDWRIRKVEPSGPVSHVLVFDEAVAVDREDLVSTAVKFLESFPGVTEVDHAEREIVEIAAHAVPDPSLTEALQHWWGPPSGRSFRGRPHWTRRPAMRRNSSPRTASSGTAGS